MSMYCNLAQAEAELKGSSTVEAPIVQQYVRQVSARIDKLMAARRGRPYFAPFQEERLYPIVPEKINSWRGTFYLDEPIISLVGVSVGSTDITSLVALAPAYRDVVSAIRFANSYPSWYDYCGASSPYPLSLTVNALWGYAPHYADAWPTYDQIITTALAPGVTTFTVNDADGADPDGITPRLSPGQLVRFGGGAEINEVTAVNTATNVVTAKRATNGTSAPAGNYAIGTDVQVFQVEDVIKRITARQAALLYSRRGAFQVTEIDGVGVTTWPQDLLVELASTLDAYQYLS